MKKILLPFAFCLMLVVDSSAQPPPPPPPGPLPPGVGAPIDNDIVLLLIAVSAFGAYKLKKNKVSKSPLLQR